ncbi:hypothetical protein [Martelella mediterranea]|uniref:hypothetical protein n=1 Tax=Martelella mediterranea TaxID=293089 RepID=UPI00104E3BDE|nr:hypothetical protein [Martelella mediterranea]
MGAAAARILWQFRVAATVALEDFYGAPWLWANALGLALQLHKHGSMKVELQKKRRTLSQLTAVHYKYLALCACLWLQVRESAYPMVCSPSGKARAVDPVVRGLPLPTLCRRFLRLKHCFP